MPKKTGMKVDNTTCVVYYKLTANLFQLHIFDISRNCVLQILDSCQVSVQQNTSGCVLFTKLHPQEGLVHCTVESIYLGCPNMNSEL